MRLLRVYNLKGAILRSYRLIVVVPCYNETNRLKSQVFIDYLKSHPGIHFLFVNDGSTDGTEALLLELQRELPDKVHLLSLPENVGKAEAVRNGLITGLKLHPDFIAYWDADLATPLEEISPMMSLLGSQPKIDIVIGARVKLLGFEIKRRMIRHYLGRLFATCASMILKMGVYDTQCGAKIFRVTPQIESVFAKKFSSRWVFDVELIARFIRQSSDNRSKIHELPLKSWADIGGSKVHPRDFIRAFFELLVIYYKEARFYRPSKKSS